MARTWGPGQESGRGRSLIVGTPRLIWLHRDSPHLFGIDNCFLSVDMQNKPCSVPSSVGTKGLECSPSTPTMNSYFYKFMINLLKRFSSERKLLEVRGAFIIRSVPGASLLPQPRVSSSRRARGRGSHGLSARPVCDGCRKREKPGEEAEKRGLRPPEQLAPLYTYSEVHNAPVSRAVQGCTQGLQG